MDLRGKKTDLLVRAHECAHILGHPKHEASRFTHLSPGDRGVAVALQEYLDEQLAKIRAELFAITTRGQTE
ncbi:hypothetical protein FRUB_04521 [Fimbriiglobus ruber]|uniref:Uncharacterized protein n=1 Tax=Fimbriiglobus ruber TaxID=1908690 RepID=A0A225DN17_9BACT|nr:hypothetical protein FRUB_07984 [Fimbriiglobus ruber]OWK36923.1 hypothetical protein FRUB_07975 [Fimbriiglobus ruber]OWK42443.1 hypothetical protein FRUB_04521 [Fimbriiglobus ruber]